MHDFSASHDKSLEIHWLTTPGLWNDSAGGARYYHYLLDRVMSLSELWRQSAWRYFERRSFLDKQVNIYNTLQPENILNSRKRYITKKIRIVIYGLKYTFLLALRNNMHVNLTKGKALFRVWHVTNCILFPNANKVYFKPYIYVLR